MVSPRNSRSKSLCISRSVTGMPQRARSNDNIAPAGPAPTIQQEVSWTSRSSSSVDRAEAVGGGAMDWLTSVAEILDCEESNDNWGSWQEIQFRADRLPGAHSLS